MEYLSDFVIERRRKRTHMVKNRIPVCHVAVCFQNAACLTPQKVKAKRQKSNRIIGLDMHPDVFSAAALEASNAADATVEWVHDRCLTSRLEGWAGKFLQPGDVLVLEASGNSFEVCKRFHSLGYTALVLESAQASKIRENYCNDDRHSAVKLARVYLSGLVKLVWQPDEESREHREIHFAHRNVVKDTTRCRNRIRSFLNEHCVRLPKGTQLTRPSGLQRSLELHDWSPLQANLLRDKFAQLWDLEKRRKSLEQVMVRELIAHPQWAQLWRLMGVRHRVAFALMAMIGDVHRFPSAKKLVGYFGLSPRKQQSGNNPRGKEKGLTAGARADMRSLIIQSAQNALNQRNSPLHKWGWKLLLRKNRNLAAAAVARKLVVAIWHLLNGHYTPMLEINSHLEQKLLRLATVLGKPILTELGYDNRAHFTQEIFKKIQLTT